MLISSPRYSPEDTCRWRELERADAVYSMTKRFSAKVTRAEAALLAFAPSGGCYVGTSWGKDSVVVAEMAYRLRPELPLVWISLGEYDNPDCRLVRDAFLAERSSARYDEIVIAFPRSEDGARAGTGVLEGGFAEAARRHGDRYVSGVRGAESGARKLRMMIHGESSARTCAPIGWWQAADVWAYLYSRGLPVHPAYACMGGVWERDRIRVASIGGQRGQGHGRAEWESRYYPVGSALAR